jgi:hypothetical protein
MPRRPGHAPLIVLLRVALLVSGLPTLGFACAVCVGSSPEDAGYFWGVLFLMGMPFTVGGLIGGWLLYHFWRARGGALSSTSSAVVAESREHVTSLAAAPAIGHDNSQWLHGEMVHGTAHDR